YGCLALFVRNPVMPKIPAGLECPVVRIDSPRQIRDDDGVGEIGIARPLEGISGGAGLMHPSQRRWIQGDGGAVGGTITPFVGKRRPVRRKRGGERGKRCEEEERTF